MTFFSRIGPLFIASAMAAGCNQGAIVLHEDAGGPGPTDTGGWVCLPPEPEPMYEQCSSPIARYTGFSASTTYNNAPIAIDPLAPLAGLVTVVSASRTGDVTTLVVDDDGIERTITVPRTTWDPDVSEGDVITARTSRVLGPTDGPAALALRRQDGTLIAAWVRAALGYIGPVDTPDLAGILHTTIEPFPDCYEPEGGQCGRGFWQLGIAGMGAAIYVGAPGTMRTPEGDIEVTLLSYFNDGWVPPEGACAIASWGGVALDARGTP